MEWILEVFSFAIVVSDGINVPGRHIIDLGRQWVDQLSE